LSTGLLTLAREGFVHGHVCLSNVWIEAATGQVLLAGAGLSWLDAESATEAGLPIPSIRADCRGLIELLAHTVAAVYTSITRLTSNFWTSPIAFMESPDEFPPSVRVFVVRQLRVPPASEVNALQVLNEFMQLETAVSVGEAVATLEYQLSDALARARTVGEEVGRLIMEAARARAERAGARDAASARIPVDAIVFERNRRGDRVRLGAGSFGVVYAGTFGSLSCAIKVPRYLEGKLVPPAVVEAFWREVTTQFLFRHENIITVHGGYEIEDGGVLEVGLVMERCFGGSLASRLHAGDAPPLQQRMTWALQVLSALAYVHARGVIHGDVKPENVLVEDDSLGARAKLVDFGLSKLQPRGDARSTFAGLHGTPIYMDVRFIRREAHLYAGAGAGADDGWHDSGSLRTASDVFSAGVLLWECVTTRMPYADALGSGSIEDIPRDVRLFPVRHGGWASRAS